MPRVLGTAARREPSHAGSWYDSDASVLSSKIDAWLDAAPQISSDDPAAGHTRALIGPHAGYSYCGHVMGAAYHKVDPSQVDRVLLLGPSHHFYTRKCALSASSSWGTPLGDLRVDVGEMEGLLERGRSGGGSRGGGGEAGAPSASAPPSAPNPLFDVLDRSDDEAEHSLELHTSFIRRVLERRKDGTGKREAVPPLIPVMVGALSPEAEAATAAALLPLARDPRTLVVVSSDFCHWGSRFQFQSLGEEEEGSDDDEEEEEGARGGGGGGGGGAGGGGPTKREKKEKKEADKETIADAIERLDRRGMRLIEQQDGPRFRAYLSKTKNTICGRFPISLFLEVARQLALEGEGEQDKGAGAGGSDPRSSLPPLRHSVKFVAYDQSQRVARRSESSVSYAAALVRVVGG